jgi:hypothetical protein
MCVCENDGWTGGQERCVVMERGTPLLPRMETQQHLATLTFVSKSLGPKLSKIEHKVVSSIRKRSSNDRDSKGKRCACA